MAERKIVSVDGMVAVFEITVKDKNKEVTATFPFCKDAESFPAWVAQLPATLPDEDKNLSLAKVFALALYAADLKARASARESVAADSTVIKRDGKDIDLLTLPVEKAIAAVNAMYMLAASTSAEPQNAFRVTREKLIAAGKAVEQNGILVVKQ